MNTLFQFQLCQTFIHILKMKVVSASILVSACLVSAAPEFSVNKIDRIVGGSNAVQGMDLQKGLSPKS